jgi:hypothetical protein
MRIVPPILLALLGFVGGAGAGWWMAPAPATGPDDACVGPDGAPAPDADCPDAPRADPGAPASESDDSEFVSLDRQFIVPVVSEDRVASMMVLTLSVEVAPGHVESVFQKEPKLRDALLRALFEHAYTGGFAGDFTGERVMRELRRNLLIAARGVVGDDIRDVLVADIIKQAQ